MTPCWEIGPSSPVACRFALVTAAVSAGEQTFFILIAVQCIDFLFLPALWAS